MRKGYKYLPYSGTFIRLTDGYVLSWGRAEGGARLQKGGHFYHVSPQTVKALERQEIIRCTNPGAAILEYELR
jgi:hypothetical protein